MTTVAIKLLQKMPTFKFYKCILVVYVSQVLYVCFNALIVNIPSLEHLIITYYMSVRDSATFQQKDTHKETTIIAFH